MADSILDVKKILNSYSKEVEEDMLEVVKRIAKETSKRVKDASPTSKKNSYRKSWTYRIDKDFGYAEATIYNAKQYYLTQLLEREHAGRNQYGKWGTIYPRSAGHISKEQQQADKEFETELSKKLGG